MTLSTDLVTGLEYVYERPGGYLGKYIMHKTLICEFALPGPIFVFSTIGNRDEKLYLFEMDLEYVTLAKGKLVNEDLAKLLE